MICCAASRPLRPKGFLSQAQSRLLIAAICAIAIFVARPAFAQRGGGGRGGGGGHWGGGGHVGGGHWGGGGSSRGGGRGVSWGGSQGHSGIVVVSGSGARGSAWIRSFPQGGEWGRVGGAALGTPGAAGLVQARFGSERDEFQSTAAPRHVTIGFPPDRGTWNRGTSPDRAAPVAFAGQGDTMWRTSPDRGAVPGRNERQAQNSPRRGQWQVHVGERGRHDRDDFFGRGFRRRWLFGANGFGSFGYPYHGYGTGLFSDCPDWLVPDCEWQAYDAGECNGYAGFDSQSAAIAGGGADQIYSADQTEGAPQADTQQIYGDEAERSAFGDAAKQSHAFEAGNGNQSAGVSAANGPQRIDTLIYLVDGTNYAVTNYWLAGGDLHYLTSYGADDSVPIGNIDLQRTVDANAAQGVPFTLHPGPSTGNAAGRR